MDTRWIVSTKAIWWIRGGYYRPLVDSIHVVETAGQDPCIILMNLLMVPHTNSHSQEHDY